MTPALKRGRWRFKPPSQEDVMHPAPLDCAGRRRSPATLSGFHHGCRHGQRLRLSTRLADRRRDHRRDARGRRSPRGLRLGAVVLWRVGLRISEALPLAESDLDKDTRRHVWCAAARAASAARSGWIGRPGSSSSRGSPCAPAARRRTFLCAPRTPPLAASAPPPGSAHCCETQLRRPASLTH